MSALLRAGFSKVAITPPPGSKLTGYSARQGVVTGVHDDLFARSLVFECGSQALALVSVEVLALAAEFVEAARERIRRSMGIHGEQILIAATHTHAGPVTIRTFFNDDDRPDPAYMERLAAAVERSVAEAWAGRFPARAGAGPVMVEGVGVNRRDPEHGPVDREAAVVRVDDAGGRTRAAAVVYGCHPTVLGFDNLQVTGDYPSMALEALEAALGPASFAMFLNGAEANVSVNHAAELNVAGVRTPGRTFARAREIGGRLAAAVLAGLPEIRTGPAPALGARMIPFELEGRRYPAERPQRAASGAEELYAAIDRANERMLAQSGGRIPFPLQAVEVAGMLFLGMPGEIFTETSLALKRLRDGPVFPIGLANGYAGYLPTEQAFAEGGYEASVASCAPDSERRVLEAAAAIREAAR